MRQTIVFTFDPLRELVIEFLERGKVKFSDEKLVTNSTEKSLDLPLRRRVSDSRMSQDAANTGTDESDFLGAIDRAVVDEELFGDAAFVEGGAEGLHEGVGVFLEEEFAVAEDAAGVVDEGDEFGLLARATWL